MVIGRIVICVIIMRDIVIYLMGKGEIVICVIALGGIFIFVMVVGGNVICVIPDEDSRNYHFFYGFRRDDFVL